MTLGHSRHGYEEAVWDQKLETFLRLHERAFRDLGGVPTVIRHDNLKAAVVRACFFDPDSHEVYLAFAAHWGFTPLPTQPRTPQENGKQERSGGYVKDNALKGRTLRQPRRAECVSAALESHHRAAAHSRHDPPPGVDALRRGRAARAAAARRRRPFRSSPRASGRSTPMGTSKSAARSIRCRSPCSGQRLRVQWDAHLVRVFHGDTLVVGARPGRGRRVCAARRRGRGLDAAAGVCRSARRPVRARRARGQAVGRRRARRAWRPRHSPDPGRARPHAPPSARARPRRRHRSARAPALSLSDHSPARRAHAGAAHGRRSSPTTRRFAR